MSELGISIDHEKSEISSSLNSTILLAFGMGMYTVIYFGTMYIYLARSSTKRQIIPAVITIMFLCNIVILGFQWYITKWHFVDKSATRDSVFEGLFEFPNWGYVVLNASFFTIFALSDGLLIWRCFFAWDRSLRIILLPLFLIFTEIAMFLVLIVLYALHARISSNAAVVTLIDDLASIAFLASFGTSLLATVLIAYRIYYTSKQTASQRRFKRIINIVVQSGAAYSLFLLVIGIFSVSPGASNPLNAQSLSFGDYTSALVTIVAGMAVTILVARVSMLPTNTTFPSTSIHLSGLEFGTNSAHQTGMEAHHLPGFDSNSVCDELQVADKTQ